MWIPGSETTASFYRVEIQTESGTPVLGALLPHTARRYDIPSWVAVQAANQRIRWRVTALAADGAHAQTTTWRSVRLAATMPSSGKAGDLRVSPR
jgi:hypothetical protein